MPKNTYDRGERNNNSNSRGGKQHSDGVVGGPTQNMSRVTIDLSASAVEMLKVERHDRKYNKRDNENNGNNTHKRDVDDRYAEAWLELGAPISIPFLRFIWALFQWALDNFFLVKNTYNAINNIILDTPLSPTDYNLWIAIATVVFHVICCSLISIVDSFNHEAIADYSNPVTKPPKRFSFFRFLAHVTLTMKLFRYLTAYLENRKNNQKIILGHMRRNPISKEEITDVVSMKKNDLVECHYDLIEAFFKTVPAALLQVFFMFQSMPDARLKLTTTTDQDRFYTVFYTIISVSVTATNYQFGYMTYKKVLHFQDCFSSRFRYDMNLNLQGNISFTATLISFIGTIGIRICFYSFILYWSPSEFLITIGVIVFLNWVIIFHWKRSSWRFRAVLENPLYGTPWLTFDMIDLWINLFIPGVHYPKPLDYFLNFYCTTLVGFFIFKGFSFLLPNGLDGRGNNNPQSSMTFDLQNNSMPTVINTISDLGAAFVNCSLLATTGDSSIANAFAVIEDTVVFIGSLIKYVIFIHENITLNQISYADFFSTVISYMNFVNGFSLLYTIFMNACKLHDLDFPMQIAHNFFTTILKDDWNSVKKVKRFLLFMVLPNSVFFNQFHSRAHWKKQITWDTMDDKEADDLLSWVKTCKILTSNQKFNKYCGPVVFLYNLVSPFVYPERVRTPKLNWDVDDSLPSVKSYVKLHTLKKLLFRFAQKVHFLLDLLEEERRKSKVQEEGEKPESSVLLMIKDEDIADVKLLLAVFFKNYNEIMRHMTSFRIAMIFAFLDMKVFKGEPEEPGTMLSRSFGMRIRPVQNYEMTYYKRIQHAVKRNRTKNSQNLSESS